MAWPTLGQSDNLPDQLQLSALSGQKRFSVPDLLESSTLESVRDLELRSCALLYTVLAHLKTFLDTHPQDLLKESAVLLQKIRLKELQQMREQPQQQPLPCLQPWHQNPKMKLLPAVNLLDCVDEENSLSIEVHS